MGLALDCFSLLWSSLSLDKISHIAHSTTLLSLLVVLTCRLSNKRVCSRGLHSSYNFSHSSFKPLNLVKQLQKRSCCRGDSDSHGDYQRLSRVKVKKKFVFLFFKVKLRVLRVALEMSAKTLHVHKYCPGGYT